MAFSFRAGTNWCHDFPKLARESGFYFNMHGSRVRVDWNRISAIDIDRVIHERDFATIDENINNVIDYCLESEYDVKILDSNFVKLFRLAQLSVEYLLYCKQYLDHSVIILKDELRQKIEQNVGMKKEISTLEDTIKSLKERSKEKCKLIETRIGESSGEIYKCPHCPKTFVSAMFVNAHVARRHLYVSDTRVSTSPIHEHYRAETEKLHNEIKTLKERLNRTERIIRNESDKLLDSTEKNYINMSKDECDIVKVDKHQEQKKYQEDIGSLKSMLFDEIRALREKEHTVKESILETNVKALIVQQEKEIENLRSQLLERLTPGIESMQIKLQTQENYWKTKMEDIEAQHHGDIERLTTELKVTQQAADRIKSEYMSKVRDLEKQSLDQSNLLIEQRKQLSCLSREISNSQPQVNNYKTKEKDTVERSHESPLLKVNRDCVNNYKDSETCRKNLNGVENSEIVIEDIGSESSQENSNKVISIAAQNKYILNKKDVKSMDVRKFITDLSKTSRTSNTAERAAVKFSPKNSEVSETIRKTKDKAKHYDALKDFRQTSDRKIFNTKDIGNISKINTTDKYTKDIERKKAFHTNDRNGKKSEFFKKHSISSITESESMSSSMSRSESDSESVTMNDEVTIKEHEMPVVKYPDMRRASMQENARSMLDNRLRDLGIDPEWQGIPTATFQQKLEIVRHQQSINAKKLIQYNRIKQKILEDVLRRISANKESGYAIIAKKSPLDKLVTRVRSKALKAFSSHKDSDKCASIQKTQNTTPSKLRLKQKIELLAQKYKDEEVFEGMRESPLKRNGTDVYSSPKAVATTTMQPRLTSNRYAGASRDIFSASSIDSPESAKRISSTKVIVSDSNARKTNSPIGRKQTVALKFSEPNDSDSTIARQENSILSPKNGKSVLKPTSSSLGSLVKKKVLFDLEDRKNGATVSGNEWNVSSFHEERENALQKEKSMSTGNIVLKTSQSDKIAEISKKIQEQLSVARKPPIGSIETIFRSDLQNLTNRDVGNPLFNSTSLASSISESPVQNFTSPKAKNSLLFPQPAPCTLKERDSIQREKESSTLKYSDLDTDIDEILQIE